MNTDIIWTNAAVFHFVFYWDPDTYYITINGKRYFPVPPEEDDFFRAGNPYAPPNMRIELGGSARAESFPGIIYRNVTIRKN